MRRSELISWQGVGLRALLLTSLVTVAACRGTADDTNTTPTQSADPDVQRFDFGRPASLEEIRRLDTDVLPDGTGLPPGSGTVARGEDVYTRSCAVCHGLTGTEGPFDVLVGRIPGDAFPFGDGGAGMPSTIGNYWPYAPTLFDYVRRSMPFNAPGTLTDDDVYSVVALLLYWNDLIGADVTLNAEVLSSVRMPAADRFVMDDREGGETVR